MAAMENNQKTTELVPVGSTRYVFISTERCGRMVIGRLGKEPIVADSGDLLDLSSEDLLLPGIQELLERGLQGRNDVSRIEIALYALGEHEGSSEMVHG